MSENMNQQRCSATLERHKRGAPGDSQPLMEQGEVERETETSGKREKKEAYMRELKEYFNALEEDRRQLQNLFRVRKEDHEKTLRALEKKRVQEQVEWERQMVERQEMLRAVMKSAIAIKKKLNNDLKCQIDKQHICQSWSFLLQPPPAVNKGKQKCLSFKNHQAWPDTALQSNKHLETTDGTTPGNLLHPNPPSCKWWRFWKRQATPPPLQDASCSSASGTSDKTDDIRITNQKDIKKAEKQQKAAEKAYGKAKEEEMKNAKKQVKKAEMEGLINYGMDSDIHSEIDE